jgi:hypothetical protein
MHLGTQTASFVNNLYSHMTKDAPTPEVGMGATILMWTDRQAATVTAVEGNIITVQEDTVTRIDDNGMSDMQEYRCEPNVNGCVYNFRMNKDGKYVEVRKNKETGRWNKAEGCGLIIGFRRHYRDFSF